MNIMVNKNKLFNVLPDNFFSVLSSPKKDIYYDCLYILYVAVLSGLSAGINREIIIDLWSDYFNSLNEDIIFEDGVVLKSERDAANSILNKFKETGWIDLEFDNNYNQIVILSDYSIKILETLEEIKNNKRVEYQGLVYTIYALLYNQETNMESNILINEIHNNTLRLISGLKTLNANIKKYIVQSNKFDNVKDVMKLHFDSYTIDILDKAYHRLKTSDNVSKFRPKIIYKLETLRNCKEYIFKTSDLEFNSANYMNVEEAKSVIVKRIDDVIYSFNNMDTIINDIDRRNHLYISSSINRIRFLLDKSKDVQGQINFILKYFISKIKVNEYSLKDYLTNDFSYLFSVFHQSFIDNKSLYEARQGKKEFEPQTLDSSFILNDETKQKLIERTKNKFDSIYTKSNIDNYVMKLLKDKSTVSSSDLPLNNVQDFLRIIYIFMYAGKNVVNYKIDNSSNIFQNEFFMVKDFVITEK